MREAIIRTSIDGSWSLPYDIDVKCCGFPKEALIPIDVDLSGIGDPRWIIASGIEQMFLSSNSYDLFINMEDDIIINKDVIDNVLAFNAVSEVNEIYLPNRMEYHADNAMLCVDLEAMPGWSVLSREFKNIELGVALNPHSGLFILDRRQFQYAANRVQLKRREQFHGGPMASAYANVHAPFLAWRARSDPIAHHVIHADRWLHSAAEVRAARDRFVDRQPASSASNSGGLLGYVDSVTIDGLSCRISGWAINSSGALASPCRVQLGEQSVTGFASRRTDRPDVAELYPQTQSKAGFEIRFSLLDLAPEALADEDLAVFANVEGGNDTPLILGPGGIWPALAAREAVSRAPVINNTPLMPDGAVARLRALLSGTDCFLEYGSGGSTILATTIGVSEVISTESDADWLMAIRHKLNQISSSSHVDLIPIDLGPTKAFGFPISDAHWSSYWRYPLSAWLNCAERGLSPRVILIDGRFRVACFLASLIYAPDGAVILFDDYFDRPYYRSIERFVQPVAQYDRAAEFIRVAPTKPDIVWSALTEAIGDIR